MNQVGILDEVPVRLVNPPPLLGIPVLPLRDLGETVALLYRVAASFRARRGGGAAAFNIGKVGLGPVTFWHHASSGMHSPSLSECNLGRNAGVPRDRAHQSTRCGFSCGLPSVLPQ